MNHIDCAYKLPNVTFKGYLCRTNIPSNTAFRGFGGAQAMIITETWMSEVAHALNMDPEKVRKIVLLNVVF